MLKAVSVWLTVAVAGWPFSYQAQAVEEEVTELEEYVVTGTRTERLLREAPVRTEVITTAEIEESGAENLYDLLDKRLIPGVWVETSCVNCQFASIRMQGLESGYTLLLFDGQPIFSGLAGVYGLREITTENIERIEVVKGAGSALYGSSALAGVINIITKEPVKDKPQLSVTGTYGDYNTRDLATLASIRSGDFAAIVTAQKHLNDYVDSNNDGYTDKVQMNNDYISAKVHYYLLEDAHRLTVFGRTLNEFRKGGYIPGGHVNEDGTLTRGIDDALDPDAEHITTDRNEYGAGYRGLFPNDGILTLDLIATEHERDATNGERPFHSKEDIWLIDSMYSQPLLDFNVVSLGLNYKDEQLEEKVNWDQSPDRSSKTYGAFIQDEIEIIEPLNLVLGVRYDDVDSTLVNDNAFNPRAALIFDVTEALALRASYGEGFRVPYLFSEDLHLCSAAPIIYINPAVEPEKSRSYNLGAEYATAVFSAEANLFRTDIKKKITLLFEEEGIPAGYDAMYMNKGDAYTQGIEANTRVAFMKYYALRLGFAFIDAQFDNPVDPEFEDSKHIMRTPDITLTLGLDFKEPTLGINAYFAGRYIGKQYVEREMTDAMPDPGYHIDHVDGFTVWDARVEKSFDEGRFTLFAGVDNIFDEVQDPIYNAEQEDTAAYIYAPLTGRYFYGGMKVSL